MTRIAGEFGGLHLRQVDVLTPVDADGLQRLTRLLRLREVKRGELVYTISGSEPRRHERVYFLLKGCVKISSIDDATGRKLLLVMVRPGEPFGLLDRPGDPHIDLVARAMQPSLVGHVPHAEFDRYARQADVGMRLRQLTGRRTVELVSRFEDLAFRSVRSRIARVLVRLAGEFPQERPCGLGISVPLTQQDVADLVSARREVVSTWLTRFKRDGVLDTHHGRLCLHDPDALARMSS